VHILFRDAFRREQKTHNSTDSQWFHSWNKVIRQMRHADRALAIAWMVDSHLSGMGDGPGEGLALPILIGATKHSPGSGRATRWIRLQMQKLPPSVPFCPSFNRYGASQNEPASWCAWARLCSAGLKIPSS